MILPEAMQAVSLQHLHHHYLFMTDQLEDTRTNAHIHSCSEDDNADSPSSGDILHGDGMIVISAFG